MSYSEIDSISALSAANIQSQVSTRVARKALDAAKEQGDSVVALLESAKTLSSEIAQSDSSHESTGVHGLDVLA